jgi:hypothetical protein
LAGGAGGLVLVVFVLLLSGGSQTKGKFEVLISGDGDPSELLRLATLLSERGIPHRLEDGCRKLSVERSRSSEARDLLMEVGRQEDTANSPGGGFFGFPTGFDLSPDAGRQRRLRASEARLAHTIALYPSVNLARVHLTLPGRTRFGRRSEPPSASVLLKLRSRRPLAPSLASSIRTLVSHAVKGLSPEDVMLVDSLGTDYGTLIQNHGKDILHHQVENQFALLREVEERVEAKVLAQLRPLFGQDGVTAAASVAFCSGPEPKGHPVMVRLKTEGSPMSHLCLSGLALSVDRHVVVDERVRSLKRRIGEAVRGALGLSGRSRLPMRLRVVSFRRSEKGNRGLLMEASSKERALPPLASISDALEQEPKEPAPGQGAGGDLGFPLGVFFLMTGAFWVAHEASRKDPISPVVEPADCSLPDVALLREDPGSRRIVAACRSEEEPDFAARILIKVLQDLESSELGAEPAGTFLVALGPRVAPEVLARVHDDVALEALASVARVEADVNLSYLDPGIVTVAWLMAQKALRKDGNPEARRICQEVRGPFTDDATLEEIDCLLEEPLRGPEEQLEPRGRLATQLMEDLSEASDMGIALALCLAPRPLARRTLVECLEAGRTQVALWLSGLEGAFPQVLTVPEEGDEILSDLLDGMRSEVRERLMDQIRQCCPELWGRLVDRRFTIREVEAFSDQDLEALLTRAPSEDLALVLREAPERLRRRCLRVLPPGVRNMVGEGLDAKVPVRLREMGRARERLGTICRDLGLRGVGFASV